MTVMLIMRSLISAQHQARRRLYAYICTHVQVKLASKRACSAAELLELGWELAGPSAATYIAIATVICRKQMLKLYVWLQTYFELHVHCCPDAHAPTAFINVYAVLAETSSPTASSLRQPGCQGSSISQDIRSVGDSTQARWHERQVPMQWDVPVRRECNCT